MFNKLKTNIANTIRNTIINNDTIRNRVENYLDKQDEKYRQRVIERNRDVLYTEKLRHLTKEDYEKYEESVTRTIADHSEDNVLWINFYDFNINYLPGYSNATEYDKKLFCRIHSIDYNNTSAYTPRNYEIYQHIRAYDASVEAKNYRCNSDLALRYRYMTGDLKPLTEDHLSLRLPSFEPSCEVYDYSFPEKPCELMDAVIGLVGRLRFNHDCLDALGFEDIDLQEILPAIFEYLIIYEYDQGEKRRLLLENINNYQFEMVSKCYEFVKALSPDEFKLLRDTQKEWSKKWKEYQLNYNKPEYKANYEEVENRYKDMLCGLPNSDELLVGEDIVNMILMFVKQEDLHYIYMNRNDISKIGLYYDELFGIHHTPISE